MSLGITVTKKIKEGYQHFGQFRAVLCDINISTSAYYILHTGFIVKPIDFGLKSIVGIHILNAVYDLASTPLGYKVNGNSPITSDAQTDGAPTTLRIALSDLSGLAATDYPNGYVGQDINAYDAADPFVASYAKIISDDSAAPSICVPDRVFTFTPAAGDRVVLPNMHAIRCFEPGGTEEALGTPGAAYDIRALVLGN